MKQFARLYNMSKTADSSQVLFMLLYNEDEDQFCIDQITEINGARVQMRIGGFAMYEDAEKCFKEKCTLKYAKQFYTKSKYIFKK